MLTALYALSLVVVAIGAFVLRQAEDPVAATVAIIVAAAGAVLTVIFGAIGVLT